MWDIQWTLNTISFAHMNYDAYTFIKTFKMCVKLCSYLEKLFFFVLFGFEAFWRLLPPAHIELSLIQRNNRYIYL